ncbi:hypothetical protein [Botrimarina colliarenosi]|uniref:hypothetical protein n=1 Tax=Botrimarina colliarenosi TaxID=2528001 RepID=UPI0018D35C6B|nr:hypothetical protein [Botrimarina colliarenosi]
MPRRTDVVREVDWLAVAPWTLLLRAPGATLGWPLVIAALGSVLFGWNGANLLPAALNVHNAWGAAWRVATSWNDGGSLGWNALRLGGWSILGLLIVALSAAELTKGENRRSFATLRRALARWPRLLGALTLVLLPAAFLAMSLWLCGLAMGSSLLSTPASFLMPLAWWLGALPLAALLAIAAVGSPLAMAAIVIDDADAFDAASRMFAYTTQRVLLLVWCVVVATALGLVAGTLVELLIAGGVSVLQPLLDVEPPVELADRFELLHRVAIHAVRGFYPAYLFTASTAIYLVLRRQVDGQPMDEIIQPAGDA